MGSGARTLALSARNFRWSFDDDDDESGTTLRVDLWMASTPPRSGNRFHPLLALPPHVCQSADRAIDRRSGRSVIRLRLITRDDAQNSGKAESPSHRPTDTSSRSSLGTRRFRRTTTHSCATRSLRRPSQKAPTYFSSRFNWDGEMKGGRGGRVGAALYVARDSHLCASITDDHSWVHLVRVLDAALTDKQGRREGKGRGKQLAG